MASVKDGLSLTLIGLLLAALSIVVPLTWEWWNKKSQVTVDVQSVAAVVGSHPELPVQKLEIMYAGKQVEELYQVVVLITNSGRTALTREDVIEPLRLSFGNGSVLEARVLEERPRNLKVRTSVVGQSLQVDFSLLNPGEAVRVAVLTTAHEPAVRADARIRNISSLEVVRSNEKGAVQSDTTVALISVGMWALVFVGVCAVGALEGLKKGRAVAGLKSATHPILRAESRQQARSIADTEFDFVTGPQRKNLVTIVEDGNWPLSEEDKGAKAKVLLGIASREPTWVIALAFVPFAAWCTYFVCSRLLDLF